MGSKTALIIALILLLCTTASAIDYYVSPSGNDDNDGLDSTTAWVSIDNGDQKGILTPGDTVNVLPGTYILTRTFQLETSGSPSMPVVYRKLGKGKAVFDSDNESNIILLLEGNHVTVEGLYLTNTLENAIHIKSDSCTIRDCDIIDVGKNGIRIEGIYSLVLRNVIAGVDESGIKNEGPGEYSRLHGNTIYSCLQEGIELKEKTSRAFNNIIVRNDVGIKGSAENICGFNNVWGNSAADYDGVVDSSGGISTDPLFVDSAAGDFSLQSWSDCIDTGLDLGYSFEGSAPDMGAIEYVPSAGEKTGTAIWRSGSATIPQFADWDGTAFGTPGNTADAGTWRIIQGVESPDRDEIVLVGVDEDRNISMILWDGATWSTSPFNPLATVSESYWWGMAVAYESTSEDARLIYNNGSTGTEGLSHAVGNSTTWELKGTITTPVAGEPQHTRCAANPVSDEIVLIVSNSSSQDYALVWDGSAWGNSIILDNGSGDDRTDVYVAYERQTHHALVVYGKATTSVYYRTWNGASWSNEDSLAKPADADGLVRWTTLGSDSNSKRIALGVLTNNQDIWLSVWDGSSWETPQTATNSAVGTTYPAVSVAFQGQSSNAIAAYGEDTSVRYRKWNDGLGWQAENTVADIGDSANSIMLYPSPASDEMMLSVQDGGSNLNYIFWDGSFWGALNELETNTGEVKNQPFIFLWDVESDVQQLYLSTIPLGDRIIHPGQKGSPILAFRIENYYDVDKKIDAIAVRDASRGAGTPSELLSNADSLALYLDIDNDSSLTPADSLVDKVAYDSSIISFTFSDIDFAPDSGKTFIVGADAGMFPRDGDSLDVMMFPTVDVHEIDNTVLAGPDSCNSLGYNIIDGHIAEQLLTTPVGLDIINPDDTIHNILTVDIPRNGYLEDTLNIFSAANGGTASASDIDSIFIFEDDGNGTWGGSVEEVLIGRMVFTGNRWTRSGTEIPLIQPLNRFYIGVRLNKYPSSGTTLAFCIPKNGLEVASGNDGPIDAATIPVDTIFIQKNEAFAITAPPISPHLLIPGASSGPILGLKFTNSYSTAVSLDSLRFTLMAIDPDGATQTQLDSQIDSVLLYLNRDGDHSNLGPEDSLIATANLSNGKCLFGSDALSIPGNGGVVELTVVTWLDANNCKNDNRINIGIADVADVYPAQPLTVDAEFPLKNDSDFVIDAFPGENITVTPIEAATYFGGQSDKPVLDIILPGNGYASDALTSLRLTNTGTLNDPEAKLLVKLWADLTGDGLTSDDLLLGQLASKESSWDISGLSYPVGTSGQRFIVTIDIGRDQFDAGTVQFAVPLEGAEYLSGMAGPDDIVVANPEAQLVFPANRITVISIPAPSAAVFPGSQKNQILTFALYNGYISQAHTLTAVNLANTSITKSDAAFADYELGQASLYFDSDNSRTLNGDSLVASGYFEKGTLHLSGLDTHLPAESLSYFFVVVDVPQEMIDRDSLAVEIVGPSDLNFSQPVNINGDLPVSSGGYLIVDGSVKKQYATIPLIPHTLSPGDTSVVLYAFRPALNGDQSDVLQALTLRNLGNADTSDIEPLELWLDLNSDSAWQTSDSLLGTFTYVGGTWEIDPIALTVETIAPVLFVLGDITATAAPNASFKGEIPLNGCEYASENDGPIDAPLTGGQTFTISNSSLKITHSYLNEAYSVGQSIEVKITTTNLLSTPIDTVLGEVIDIDNPALVAFDSSFAGPVSLPAGDSIEFVFFYTAAQIGSVSWQVRAVAPTLPDSSAHVQTDTVQIQAMPTNVKVQLINSIPTAVIRGQPNVFPLSIKYPHPDSTPVSSSLRLDSVRLSVQDGSGAPLAADDVFSRMVLATGYTNLTILENPPPQSSVLFDFSQPVIVPSGQEQILSLLVDIDSLALPDDFVLSVDAPEAVTITDNNTYQPVPLHPDIVFPLKTALCRIDDPSQQIVVSDSSLLGETVNYGQHDVDVTLLRVRHPGAESSSQIQLTGLSVMFVDEWSSPIAPSELFDRVRILRQQTVVAEVVNLDGVTSELEMILSSPLTLSPGDIDSVVIQVWAKEYSSLSGFSLLIDDSTAFVVRDLSSGSLLLAASDTMFTLATESVFPITSGWTEFRQPALEPKLCLISELPPSVVGGRDSLALLGVTVHYPATADHSSIELDEILLAVLDTLDQPLNPDRLFDRVGYLLPGMPVEYQLFIGMQNGKAVFDLGDGALIINPGDSVTIQLVADIEADTPYDHFTLVIPTESDISIVDVTDGNHHPGFTIESQCTTEFPFATGVTRIFLPAGRPMLSTTALPVRITHPGRRGLEIFDFNLDYTVETSQGELALSGISGEIFKQTPQGPLEMDGSLLFDAVHLLIDSQVVASDSTVVGDTLTLTPDSAYVIPSGTSVNLALLCDLKETAPVGNYQIRFFDSTFLEISDKNLQTTIYPVLADGSYPLYTAVISLSPATLEKSFTNYPNPFNPSRNEATTIGFVLSEAAYIDIEIFTITGEAVKEIAKNSYRLPGPHQRDVWTSDNDQGLDVLPGTYFCRITAKYDSGRTESFRRKISVVR